MAVAIGTVSRGAVGTEGLCVGREKSKGEGECGRRENGQCFGQNVGRCLGLEKMRIELVTRGRRN